MDFGALPPEINSARMYAGPGAGSMLAAAAAWNGLAGELHSGAAGYASVISGLTSGPWLGPSSMAMAAAAAPYAAWMSATASQAELAATQAQAAAAAYEAAFAMTVPPAMVAANRAQLMMLVATNFFGQNTPAIAANEAQYGAMWAQDAAAMYSYAANSAAATAQVTPFAAAPQTSNPAPQAGGTLLSQLVSTIPTTLQSLASPTSSTSGTSTILSALLGGSSAATSTTTTGPLGGLLDTSGLSLGGVASSLIAEYANLPGFFGIFTALNALGPLMGTPISMAFNPSGAMADAEGAAGAAAAEGALDGGFGEGFGEDVGGFTDFGDSAGLGGLADLGQAPAVGGLSVPPSWGWAASGPAPMLGDVPFALPDNGLGGGTFSPLMFGGLPPGTGATAAANAGGTNPAKYGPRLGVVPRPPAAGYPPLPRSPRPAAAFSVPAGFPPPAPGYTPTIVYLPTNGHAPPTT